jgi:hypothetical protein
VKLAEYKIAGAMVPPMGKAAFDRGELVLVTRREPIDYLQVRSYVGADEVEGGPVEPEEWHGLLLAEHGMALPEADAESGLAFWIFRPVFAAREAAIAELRAAMALRRDVIPLMDGTFGCLVHEPSAAGLRDRWAERAHAEAFADARAGRWEEARVAASRAFVIEPAMAKHPERVAMLSLAHLRCGNEVGGNGYLGMARNSWGQEYARQVLAERAAIASELSDAKPVA